MSLPLVSVIIPCYNSARYVAQAVDSALAQTYSPAEIIVVDDGSTDNSAEVLKAYELRIQYVYQSNCGLGGARNRGIREARGEFIAFLDADDFWVEEKLNDEMQVFLSNAAVGLVHSDCIYFDEHRDRYFTKQLLRHTFVGRCYARLFFGNRIFVSTVVVRKECLDTVGLFDEQTFPGTEDYDLWLRVAQKYEFAYVPRHLAIYRHHSLNMSHNLLHMRTAELSVIRQALASNPSLSQTVGQASVKRRLFNLYFHIAYLHFDAGNFAEARQFLFEALRIHPANSYGWTLWLSTFLPPPYITSLRRAKRWFARDEA
jgi:glycosyltransferase involved in cell wall biosynthesis